MRVQALMTASELEQAGYGANRVAMTGGADCQGQQAMQLGACKPPHKARTQASVG